jgi:hypothetical protein
MVPMVLKKQLSLAMAALFLVQTSGVVLAAPDPAEKKTKEEKAEEKEKKADEKNAASYETIKEFSLNKYKTDPKFRDEVDAAFEEVMRTHSEEAFHTNINRKSQLVFVNEDTWRMHSALYDNLLVQDHVGAHPFDRHDLRLHRSDLDARLRGPIGLRAGS